MNKDKIIKLLLGISIFIYFILSFLTSRLALIVLYGVLILILIALLTILSQKSYANKFWEIIGTGMISGLVVSFFRDIIYNSLSPAFIRMYIVVSVLAIFLIIIGLLGKSTKLP